MPRHEEADTKKVGRYVCLTPRPIIRYSDERRSSQGGGGRLHIITTSTISNRGKTVGSACPLTPRPFSLRRNRRCLTHAALSPQKSVLVDRILKISGLGPSQEYLCIYVTAKSGNNCVLVCLRTRVRVYLPYLARVRRLASSHTRWAVCFVISTRIL